MIDVQMALPLQVPGASTVPDLSTYDRILVAFSGGKDFNKFKEAIVSIQNWYEAAQQLSATPSYLKAIAKTEQDLRQGKPISEDVREKMNRDVNQLAYNQLSANLNQEDARAFLIRLSANAFKQGISSFRVKDILSFSPMIRDLETQKGERATQQYAGEIVREGWKLKKREQPLPPGQNRGPDIDRGPSRGR